MDKKCVVMDINLAVILGVSESIILQQMYYWLQKSTHIIEGRHWVFNSYANWQKQLPFFCESTIRRLIKKLEDMGIILSANFNKSKMDKTKWYSIDFDALNKLQEEFNEPLDDSDNSDSEGNNLQCANNEQMDGTTQETNCSNLAVDEINLTKPIPEITPETTPKDVVVVERKARPLEEKVNGVDVRNAKGKPASFEDIKNFFSSNIHLPIPHECEKLRLLYEDLKDGELTIKVMENMQALNQKIQNFQSLAGKILLNSYNDFQEELWNNKNNLGLKTIKFLIGYPKLSYKLTNQEQQHITYFHFII